MPARSPTASTMRALMYEVLSQRSTPAWHDARRPRLGIPRRWLHGRLEAGVRESFERLVAALAADADIVDADVATMPLAWEHYTPIVRAEGAWIHRAALAAGGEGLLRAGHRRRSRRAWTISAAQYFDAMSARRTFSDELDRQLARHRRDDPADHGGAAAVAGPAGGRTSKAAG